MMAARATISPPIATDSKTLGRTPKVCILIIREIRRIWTFRVLRSASETARSPLKTTSTRRAHCFEVPLWAQTTINLISILGQAASVSWLCGERESLDGYLRGHENGGVGGTAMVRRLSGRFSFLARPCVRKTCTAVHFPTCTYDR